MRVTIEKCIGVIKKRFKKLANCVWGKYETQNKTIWSCIMVHNFLMDRSDEVDAYYNSVSAEEIEEERADHLLATFNDETFIAGEDAPSGSHGYRRRKIIGNRIWREYCSEHEFELVASTLIM